MDQSVSSHDVGAEELDTLADEALEQIDLRRYDSEMRASGFREVLKFGIAFSGKKVRVKMKRCGQYASA